jgi:hypothetical protein
MSDVDAAAEVYREATGQYPAGYTPPGEETPEEKLQAANEAYFQATGVYPGQDMPNKPLEEAPEDKFSHYLQLADGRTVRFAVSDRRPNDLPTSFNGVPVVNVHNAIPMGKEAGQ